MDLHALSIGSGVLLMIVYVSHCVKKSTTFSPFTCGVMFLCGYAFIGGIQLIIAAWKNDPSRLPLNWPEYMGAAGAVGMGLAIEQVIKLFRSFKPFTVSKETDVVPKRRKSPYR